MRNSFISSFFLLFAISIFSACTTEIVKQSDSAEDHFKYATALSENDRNTEAILEFQDIKNKFPYSRFAIESELAIADIHFQRESFLEAQTAYEIFKELHPKNNRIAYVTYKIGLSYFNQLPSTVDRDLSLAEKAILYFEEVITSYSNSAFVEESEKKRNETLKMLAGKELYIADFYFKQKVYESALARYEGTYKKYSGLGLGSRILYGASASAYYSGDHDKGKTYFEMLLARHPKSKQTAEAKKELSRYANE